MCLYLQTIASPLRQSKTESGIQLGLFKDSHKTRHPTDSGRVKSCNLTLRIDYHPGICPNYIWKYFKMKDHNRSDNPGNQMVLHTLLLIHNTNWECFSQADLSKKYWPATCSHVTKTLYAPHQHFPMHVPPPSLILPFLHCGLPPDNQQTLSYFSH